MKINITRQAIETEAAACLEAMALRAQAGAEILASLSEHITPQKIAEAIASLSESSRRQFSEPPVRRRVKFTHRPKLKP